MPIIVMLKNWNIGSKRQKHFSSIQTSVFSRLSLRVQQSVISKLFYFSSTVSKMCFGLGFFFSPWN